MNNRTPYQMPSKGSARGIVSRVFTFALSAMMLVQGLALATPVSAQTRASVIPPAAQQARQYTPQQRGITVGQPVNMRNLAASRTLAPAAAGRVELKPIHPPLWLVRGWLMLRSTSADAGSPTAGLPAKVR